MPRSKAAKTRNPLKFAGVPQTNERISAASGLKFTIFWGHVEDILLLNKFFRLSICARLGGRKVNPAPGEIPLRGNSCRKCSLPAQMTANGLTSCKVWLVSVERCRCSNEAKMRKPLKFAGVPQTRQSISADSGPKFTILWEHVEEILLLSKFFSDCR